MRKEKEEKIREPGYGAVRRGLYDAGLAVGKIFRRNGGKKKKIMAGEKRAAIFVTLMLAFPVAQILVFYFGVNVNSIMLAFKSYDSTTSSFYWSGLNNFSKVITDLFTLNVLITSAKNSAILYLVGLLIATPLNIVFAYCIYKKVPLYGFFRVVLFLPSIISSVVLALTFKYFVEHGIPELAALLKIENFPNLLRSPTYSFPVVVFYGLWSGFGGALILYTGAMTRIPDELIEFGQLEGISLPREFFGVVLPLIFPTLTTYLIIGIAGFFTGQGAIYIFYGAGAEEYMSTYGYYFFTRVVNSTGAVMSYSNYPYAVAGGLVFTLVAAPLTFLAKYLLEKFGPSAEF